MQVEKLYITEFINKSSTNQVVREFGRELLALAPGQVAKVAAYLPTTSYARFSKVVYERDGDVTVRENSDWAPPSIGPFQSLTEILNVDGAAIESITVNGEPILCYKGIPRLVYPDLTDPLVFYKSMTFKNVTKKVPDPGMPSYLVRKTTLNIIKEQRSKRDCQKIKSMLEDRIKERALRDMKLPQGLEV